MPRPNVPPGFYLRLNGDILAARVDRIVDRLIAVEDGDDRAYGVADRGARILWRAVAYRARHYGAKADGRLRRHPHQGPAESKRQRREAAAIRAWLEAERAP
jgi:hypothetical protein